MRPGIVAVMIVALGVVHSAAGERATRVRARWATGGRGE